MVPRTRLVEVLAEVYRIAERYDLVMGNVFHAGDGNLHPLIVFDRRQPGVMERVLAAGKEIIETCVAAGGVLSGEHGIGLEKRDYMGLIFSEDDLAAQAWLRDAFDPDGGCNPWKVLPAGSGCGDLQNAASAGRGFDRRLAGARRPGPGRLRRRGRRPRARCARWGGGPNGRSGGCRHPAPGRSAPLPAW